MTCKCGQCVFQIVRVHWLKPDTPLKKTTILNKDKNITWRNIEKRNQAKGKLEEHKQRKKELLFFFSSLHSDVVASGVVGVVASVVLVQRPYFEYLLTVEA